MVEELVDMVVVDVRIVAENLMALKMQLLIEKEINMGVGMGAGAVELATLIGSGLLMLLKMVTTTTNSLLSWAFVSNVSKHHTCQVGGRSCTKTTRRRSSQHQTDR